MFASVAFVCCFCFDFNFNFNHLSRISFFLLFSSLFSTALHHFLPFHHPIVVSQCRPRCMGSKSKSNPHIYCQRCRASTTEANSTGHHEPTANTAPHRSSQLHRCVTYWTWYSLPLTTSRTLVQMLHPLGCFKFWSSRPGLLKTIVV